MHSALAMGIYIYVCNASARMRRHVRIPTVRSRYRNEFLRVRIMIFLGWLNTCVRCDRGERDWAARARILALGRERVQQARNRQTEEQRQRTRQLDRSRRRMARQ